MNSHAHNMHRDASAIDHLLGDLGFSTTHYVALRASIADLFGANERCGIYVLHCSNDEYYAGQAVDVVRRYNQHRIVHTDIDKISFKIVQRDQLNEEERKVIWSLESNGVLLRNIALTSIPLGESDFDLIMPLADQEKWLADLSSIDITGERFDEPDLRRKYHRRYETLVEMPDYNEALIGLRSYVRHSIPRAKQGEVSFWCCSCLPPARCKVFSRINVYQQEVFTTGRDEQGLFFSMHMALSPIEDAYGNTPEGFFDKYPNMYADDHFYPSGGPDQFQIIVGSPEELAELLDDPVVMRSVRLFILRLMKKGPCLNKANHCFDLADRLLE